VVGAARRRGQRAGLRASLSGSHRRAHRRTYRARAYLHSGQAELALAEFLELRKRDARTPGSVGDVGQALAVLGRLDEAHAELARARQPANGRYVPALDIATLHASLGERDDAFRWLERAFAERSTNISFLEYDPSFDVLHEDPRFAALVQRINARKLKPKPGNSD
jgi:tetratricopeptide (TPR) repeat protein